MRPVEIAVRDFGLQALEFTQRDKFEKSFIRSAGFSNPERIPGELDTSCRALYSLDVTHYRHAEAKKIGTNAYHVYEVHSVGGVWSGLEMRPLTIGETKTPMDEVLSHKDAKQMISVWEATRIKMQIPRQEVVRSAEKTPFHPSHFRPHSKKSAWLNPPL